MRLTNNINDRLSAHDPIMLLPRSYVQYEDIHNMLELGRQSVHHLDKIFIFYDH